MASWTKEFETRIRSKAFQPNPLAPPFTTGVRRGGRKAKSINASGQAKRHSSAKTACVAEDSVSRLLDNLKINNFIRELLFLKGRRITQQAFKGKTVPCFHHSVQLLN
jgi:hypothetical protein